ncbi:MAG: class I SAM-dependent methyltransferase [Candidatus Sulfotelmatobacter sp.]
MASIESSRNFWNEKAKENPIWYVSSYGPYHGRDEADFWRSGSAIWEQIKGKIGYLPASKDVVVEVGSGVGRLSRVISSEVGTLYGTDISAEMLELARAHNIANGEFSLGDGASLRQFGNGSADLVLGYCVFQHLPSIDILRGYLQEMCRVAKPGGLIAFTLVPHDWWSWLEPLAAMKNRLFPADGPKGIHTKEWRGIRPTRNEVEKLSPIPLKFTFTGSGQWLFYGRVGS